MPSASVTSVLLFACMLVGCGGDPTPPAEAPPALTLEQVRGTSVSLAVDDAELGEVVAHLASETGIPMRFSDAAEDAKESHVAALNLQDVSLATALTMLQSVGGEDLAWFVEGGAVVFDLLGNRPEKMVVQIHALFLLDPGFSRPPRIILESDEDVADEDTPLFGDPDEEDDPLDRDAIDDLMERIRKDVGPPGTWDPPAELRSLGTYTLMVKHTPEIQEQVAKFLDRHRQELEGR